MTDQTAVPDVAPPPSTPLVVQVVQISDMGLVRTDNQDFAILSTPERELPTSGKGRLMLVADGMGGHRGGATASRLAATTIRDAFMESDTVDVAGALRQAMETANSLIFRESQTNIDLRGMGTTCSVLVIRDDRAYIGHVGDSRIYRVRDGEIYQLTEDHSLVATMVKEGLLTSQEAEVHPRRNVLQRSMGVGEQVDIDILEPFEVKPGDTFILCSDGLHGLVKEPELLEIAQQPIEEAAAEFVRRAIDRGAPDNVTVIVARVEAALEPGAMPAETEVTFADEDETLRSASATPAARSHGDEDETLRSAPVAPAARSRGGIPKWLLVLFVLLAVGGAIAFWAYATNQSMRP